MKASRRKTITTRIFLVILAVVISLNVFSACGRPAGSNVVAGSTSMLPYVEKLAHEFNSRYTGNFIDVQGGGSSAGIMAAREGIAGFGMSSRALKPSESDLWSKEIAKDGLAIIIHPENPIIKKNNSPGFVADLTLEEISKIYSGNITNWSDVGGSDAAIHVITREEGSGTRSAFEDIVMASGSRITKKAIVQNSNGAVRMLVSDDPDAIGFISLGLVNIEGRKPVKTMRIDGVDAAEDKVLNGEYKLARSFLLISKAEPIGREKEFLDFILSAEGREILSDAGLIIPGAVQNED